MLKLGPVLILYNPQKASNRINSMQPLFLAYSDRRVQPEWQEFSKKP